MGCWCTTNDIFSGLTMIGQSLMGEAMLKGKKVWTKRVASRRGFTGTDWAPEWMSELEKCGLPGPDYIVRAPNVDLTAWLRRPAEYRDFARAYHLLLMVYGGESPSSVVEYTPHGCRHVQVTAGAQLAAQGIISEQSLESLGQWERGSKMPKTYDSASCVSELQTRGHRRHTDGRLEAGKGRKSPSPTDTCKNVDYADDAYYNGSKRNGGGKGHDYVNQFGARKDRRQADDTSNRRCGG